ncbi:PREDICTED: cytochrome P450 94B3-like [Nelumbo nucifera]|uniref:Cytochrome P450 94B3-like n=1 Tax=Nelumbo nucifera TaxID=4432 RepID=A0A1U8PZR8_NELNU|nr:PREDICTED: cytochrome P450 94B3-like [Nelumbo nucifera]
MDLFCVQSLILFFFLLFYFYFYFYVYPLKMKAVSNVGFKVYPFFGSLPEFFKNRNRFVEWVTDILASNPTNTAVYHRPVNIRGIMTANPLNVQHMLKNNFDNYPKGELFTSHLEDFLGRGIFNVDGHLWKVQRKTASSEFSTKSLRNFVMDIVNEETLSRLVPLLRKASGQKIVVDMQDIMERFAFDHVCKLAFNVDPGCLGGDNTAGAEFMKAFNDAATLSAGRFLYFLPYLWKMKRALNIGSEERLRSAISTVHDFADKIIRSRMQEKEEKQNDEDLLSRFIANESNSPEFLRDIIINFILAGRDTTSTTLSWFFWLLSNRPEVERKILDELKLIRASNGKKIDDTYSFNELREMQYLQAALSEALRLYPPVALDTKVCRKDDVMPDGTFVGKGWFVTYHAYAMGRMESIWGKDCLEFKPERWLENGVCRRESPFRFPAFHAGPRICLGKDMAYILMKSITASVIQRFQMEVVDKDKCPELVVSLTLRMKEGLPMRVKERC